jgi:hypothetical protein
MLPLASIGSFRGFLSRASRAVEDVLAPPAPPSWRYDAPLGPRLDTRNSALAGRHAIDVAERASTPLRLAQAASDGRPVVDMDWDRSDPDSFLVSYAQRTAARAVTGVRSVAPHGIPRPTDGLALVWDVPTSQVGASGISGRSSALFRVFKAALAVQTEATLVYSSASITTGIVDCYLATRKESSPATPPPHTFIHGCGSPSAARFHDGLGVLAGTTAGVILLYDKRAGSDPVQQTCVSMSSHTHPVIALLPAESGTGVVSVSSDGRVCEWDALRLDRPVVSARLGLGKQSTVFIYSSVCYAAVRAVCAPTARRWRCCSSDVHLTGFVVSTCRKRRRKRVLARSRRSAWPLWLVSLLFLSLLLSRKLILVLLS